MLLGVTRCGWWQPGWIVLRQPSRGSWLVTAAGSGIGLIVPTGLPYAGADVLNHRNWRPIINFGWWWRRNSRCGGHRNRWSSG